MSGTDPLGGARVRFGPEIFRIQARGGVSRYIVELHRGLLRAGVDSAIEIGVVDEKIDPAHTRSKITQALAEAPARRGRHKNIAL